MSCPTNWSLYATSQCIRTLHYEQDLGIKPLGTWVWNGELNAMQYDLRHKIRLNELLSITIIFTN